MRSSGGVWGVVESILSVFVLGNIYFINGAKIDDALNLVVIFKLISASLYTYPSSI